MSCRRLLSPKILGQDNFKDMPFSTQMYYIQLIMNADDDGFLDNARSIMASIQAKEDDYKILMAKNYIIEFPSGIVCIRHWNIHNRIKKDRYKPTIYKREKAMLVQEDDIYYLKSEVENYVEIEQEKEPEMIAENTCSDVGSKMEPRWSQDGALRQDKTIQVDEDDDKRARNIYSGSAEQHANDGMNLWDEPNIGDCESAFIDNFDGMNHEEDETLKDLCGTYGARKVLVAIMNAATRRPKAPVNYIEEILRNDEIGSAKNRDFPFSPDG